MVELHHIQLGLETWKSKMKHINAEFNKSKNNWFFKASFFRNLNPAQSPRYIQFIHSKYFDSLVSNYDLEGVSKEARDYYGMNHFPDYAPDWMKQVIEDVVSLWFDSQCGEFTH